MDPTDNGGDGNRIVVGVDGSEPSREALRWAVAQARLTGARVDAIMSWEWPGHVAWAGLTPPTAATDETIEGSAQLTLLTTIDETVGPEPQVRIRALTQPGSPVRVLLEAAEGASLLVVGSRGLGGFKGALLGSVSQHLSHHAPCPLVIVRAPEAK
ncbi:MULTISPECIES: universal stress protein [Streptomyces]|uniref:Universal stress protein n=1 Tax=Streptomyces lycii TaxID=2654337 RepID=A0ABQ7FHU7_9ACTN|nr:MULTISPECIES: universal stress protein [Streptomyces]KAF4407391.1 universal stress protein [Streptomyces lycii]PGH49883.1 universal stress protein UspA [Streptomyces sp. Ru87]